MSFATLNGRRVLSATVYLRDRGVSWLDAVVDSSSGMSGRVTFTAAGLTFVGTVDSTSSAVYQDTLRVVVRAGGNGLGGTVSPKFYRNAPISVALADLLTAAGETLSSDADASVTSRVLPSWTRPDGSIARALDVLVGDHGGAQWRIAEDGKFWCGANTYPAHDFTHQMLDHQPAARVFVLASDRLIARPGRTFLGERVTEVQFELTARAIRTRLIYGSTLAQEMAAAVGRMAPDASALKFYAGAVAMQHSDGTLDIKPDDVTHAPASGWTRVAIRYGLPGVSARVSSGARVLVCYENGDRGKPVATLWESSESTLVELSLAGGTASVARSGDDIATGWYTFTSAAAGSPVLIVPVPFGTPGAVQLTGSITGTGSPKVKA